MTAIGEVIKQVKDQQGQSIRDISEVTYESIQNALSKVNQIGDSTQARLSAFEQAISDTSFKVDTMQEQALKHARLTNDTMGKETQRTEKIIATLENFTKQQVSDIRKDIAQIHDSNSSWQVNFEDLQARKILEN